MNNEKKIQNKIKLIISPINISVRRRKRTSIFCQKKILLTYGMQMKKILLKKEKGWSAKYVREIASLSFSKKI